MFLLDQHLAFTFIFVSSFNRSVEEIMTHPRLTTDQNYLTVLAKTKGEYHRLALNRCHSKRLIGGMQYTLLQVQKIFNKQFYALLEV